MSSVQRDKTNTCFRDSRPLLRQVIGWPWGEERAQSLMVVRLVVIGTPNEGPSGMCVSRRGGMKSWNETHSDALLNVMSDETAFDRVRA